MKGEGVVSQRVVQRLFQHFCIEEEITKICHILEDLNYGILRIYAEVWKKIRKKAFVSYQKTLAHQKMPYLAKLRHMEIHTQSVDMYPCEFTPQ